MRHTERADVEVLPAEQPRDEDTGQYVPLLDEEAIERIATGIRAGATLEGAARYAGVSRATFYRWLTAGRRAMDAGETDTLPVKLVEAIDAALGDFELGAVARIQKAGEDPKAWQAMAWLLERRFPDAYGRRQRIDVGDTDDPRVKVLVQALGEKLDPGRLSDEELDMLIDLHTKMLPENRQIGEGG